MKILNKFNRLICASLFVIQPVFLNAEENKGKDLNGANESETVIESQSERLTETSMDDLVQDALIHQKPDDFLKALLFHPTDLDYFCRQLFPGFDQPFQFLSLAYIINADHLWKEATSEHHTQTEKEDEQLSKRRESLLRWAVQEIESISNKTFSDENRLPSGSERMRVRSELYKYNAAFRKEQRQRLIQSIKKNIDESIETGDVTRLTETVYDQRDNNRILITEILRDLPREPKVKALVILLNEDSYWLDQYEYVVPEYDDNGVDLNQRIHILHSIQGIAMQLVHPEAGRLEALLGPKERLELSAALQKHLANDSED